jgi:hypothetical protein
MGLQSEKRMDYTECNAFSHAMRLYDSRIGCQTPPPERKIRSEFVYNKIEE